MRACVCACVNACVTVTLAVAVAVAGHGGGGIGGIGGVGGGIGGGGGRWRAGREGEKVMRARLLGATDRRRPPQPSCKHACTKARAHALRQGARTFFVGLMAAHQAHAKWQ